MNPVEAGAVAEAIWLAGINSQHKSVWAGVAMWNSLKPSLNQTKLIQMVSIGFSFGFRNSGWNRTAQFPVWEKMA